MKKTIYIPTQAFWNSMVDQAGREGVTVSEYLLNIHKEHLGCLGNDKWKSKDGMPAEIVIGITNIADELDLNPDQKRKFIRKAMKKLDEEFDLKIRHNG